MAIKVCDIDGERRIVIDAHSRGGLASVFVTGPRGLCVELDREVFLAAVAAELDCVLVPERLAA